MKVRFETSDPVPEKNKIFLGGTCTSSWRDEIIPALDYYEIDYFNPIVEDWTPECIEIEDMEKNDKCNIHLYYFDSSMKGVYSVAELVSSCYNIDITYIDDKGFEIKPFSVALVLFIVNTDGFDEDQLKSFRAVLNLLRNVTDNLGYMETNSKSMKNDLIEAIREADSSVEYIVES